MSYRSAVRNCDHCGGDHRLSFVPDMDSLTPDAWRATCPVTGRFLWVIYRRQRRDRRVQLVTWWSDWRAIGRGTWPRIGSPLFRWWRLGPFELRHYS